MICVARMMVTLVGFGGGADQKRSEPHGRYQVEIYLELESGVSRRGAGKARGRNMIGRVAATYRRVVSATWELTFSLIRRWRGGYPLNESQERKIRKDVLSRSGCIRVEEEL